MPPVKASDHDTFGYRLIQILKKLNQGDKLDPKALAEEFNVSLRAIQRDLKERFAFLQLEKTNGLYYLHPAFLGKLSLRDVQHFARLAGVSGLFPSGADDFLRELFDARMQTALLVIGPHYEDLGGKKTAFGNWSKPFWPAARSLMSTEKTKAQKPTPTSSPTNW